MTYTAYYDELYYSAREAWQSADYEHLKGMFSRTTDTVDYYQTPAKHGKRFDFDELSPRPAQPQLEDEDEDYAVPASATARSAPRGCLHYRGGTNGKRFQVPILSTMLVMVLFTGLFLTMPSTTSAQRYGEGARASNRLLGGGYHGYAGGAPPPHDRFRTQQYMLLSDVQTLTLHNGRMTTGRRSSPVPQATSIGGTAQGQYTPSSIQCTNKGWDGVDAQWECKADLDNAYRFGETTVVCEGYDYPDDPYILAGSCGVEYTLELTQEGRDIQKAKASSSNNGGYGYTQGVNYNKNNYARGDSSSDGIGGVMFAMFIVLIIVMACSGSAGSSHTTVHHTAPPAYSSSGYGHGGYGGYGSRRSTGSGFWPGFIGGSIAGSAFSSSRPSSYNSGYSSSRGNSSWGGSSGGGGSTFSSGTRTASGYGGTRRR